MAKTKTTEEKATKTKKVTQVTKKVEKKEVAAKEAKPATDEAKKVKSKKVRSKKYQEAATKVDRQKNYPLNDAVELVRSSSYSKFDGTFEIHIDTAIKGVRGLVTLPFASGKKLKILAFGKNAEESGADIIGDDEKLKEIEKGRINFDVLVTTPEWMPKIARMAKVLGPRGLMPNPKSGTVTDDLKKTVAELQAGKTEYKSEARANVIHLSLGKLSQPNEELNANTKTLLNSIGKSKVKKVTLASTMGPGVKLDLSSI